MLGNPKSQVDGYKLYYQEIPDDCFARGRAMAEITRFNTLRKDRQKVYATDEKNYKLFSRLSWSHLRLIVRVEKPEALFLSLEGAGQ